MSAVNSASIRQSLQGVACICYIGSSVAGYKVKCSAKVKLYREYMKEFIYHTDAIIQIKLC
jgi:hypothetical protein